MRTLLSNLLTILTLLSAALVSNAAADETVVHLAEDAPAGQVLVDLRALLQLQPTERVRLEPGPDGTFRIDARERLIVAHRDALDHESQPQHRLNFRIIEDPVGSRGRRDPLRSRFKELVSEQQDEDQSAAVAEGSTVRTAKLRVLIDDVPEPPLLLGSRFRAAADAPARPGQRIGRAIVIDLDREEQHRFELLEGGTWLRIDPASGELFLRDDVDPLSIATLQTVVQVTDRAGLTALAQYPVWLNDRPPAPSLPFRTSDRPPATENPPPAPAVLAAAPATPPPPPMPHVVTETASTSSAGATTKQPAPVASAASAPPTPEARPRRSGAAQSGGQTPGLGPRGPADVQRTAWSDQQRRGWLIVAAATVCVAVIIISGVRNAVVAGRAPVGTSPEDSAAATQGQPPRNAGERDPREVAEILERLDAVIGRSEQAVAQVPPEAVAAAPAADAAPADDSGGDTRPKGTDEKQAAATGVSAAALPTAATQASVATENAAAKTSAVTAESAVTLYPAPPLQRQTPVTDEERARIEQFREISRMMNRADIGRHHRERMRDEWLSVGVTTLACVITGSVCVFTSCFGPMSVPLGSVMFSIATALLMRPSLYPPIVPHGAPVTPPSAAEPHHGK